MGISFDQGSRAEFARADCDASGTFQLKRVIMMDVEISSLTQQLLYMIAGREDPSQAHEVDLIIAALQKRTKQIGSLFQHSLTTHDKRGKTAPDNIPRQTNSPKPSSLTVSKHRATILTDRRNIMRGSDNPEEEKALLQSLLTLGTPEMKHVGTRALKPTS